MRLCGVVMRFGFVHEEHLVDLKSLQLCVCVCALYFCDGVILYTDELSVTCLVFLFHFFSFVTLS